MRVSPLFTGFFYLLLGAIFTVFGIIQVQANGWTFITYTLAFFATIDFGVGLKLVGLHFRLKRRK